MVLNGTGSINNSQCTIDGTRSAASSAGNVVTLTLGLSFAPSFAGNKVIYLAARDTSQIGTGWQTMGVVGVPPAPTTYPSPVRMTPSSGATANTTLSFTFQDASAGNNFQTVWALMNTALDGRAACYVAYYRPANLIYLVPDNGDGTQAYVMALTGTNSVSNSQCTVSAQGSSANVSGAQLTLNLNLTFKHAFQGPKAEWMAAQTLDAQTSPWQALGAWMVP